MRDEQSPPLLRFARRYFFRVVLLAVACAVIVLFVMYVQRNELSPQQFETAPSSLAGPSATVAGVVLRDTDYALTAGRVLQVKTEGGEDFRVVVNKYSVCRWPDAWGPVVIDPAADVPDVAVPLGSPKGLEGVRVTAQVTRANLGLFKKPWFATEIAFGD